MRTLGDIARYQARHRPRAVALSFEGRETDYETFDRHSTQVANKLLEQGVSKEQRIACIGKNSDYFYEILFGAAKVGAGSSPMPLDLLRQCMDVFGCGFCQTYGLTETCGTIVYLPPEDHDGSGNQRMRAAGIPMPGVEIKVVDERAALFLPVRLAKS